MLDNTFYKFQSVTDQVKIKVGLYYWDLKKMMDNSLLSLCAKSFTLGKETIQDVRNHVEVLASQHINASGKFSFDNNTLGFVASAQFLKPKYATGKVPMLALIDTPFTNYDSD